MLTTLGARPRVVENGADFIRFPYTVSCSDCVQTGLAFAPNGDAFFVDAPNELVRFSVDGSYVKVAVPHAIPDPSYPILYARDELWLAARNGVVRAAPDGSHVRFYALSSGNAPVLLTGLTYGPDGDVYAATEPLPQNSFKSYSGKIFRIDRSGDLSSVLVPAFPEALAFGSDGKLYFAYDQLGTGTEGIGRIESNGSPTLFSATGSVGATSLVASGNELYFSSAVYNAVTGMNDVRLGRISTAGVISALPVPALSGYAQLGNLSVDKGGNVWIAMINLPAQNQDFAYQYNTFTGHFTGPFEPTLINTQYLGPFVGPDDNVWFVLPDSNGDPIALAAFVRHVQTLEPASLSLVRGHPTPFTILETHFNGPWTVRSLSPAVAAVSPATSASGEFIVTETGPGMTSIAVTDRLGNISYELVTAL